MTETPEATIARLTAELEAAQEELKITGDRGAELAIHHMHRAEAAEAERAALIGAAYEAARKGYEMGRDDAARVCKNLHEDWRRTDLEDAESAIRALPVPDDLMARLGGEA